MRTSGGYSLSIAHLMDPDWLLLKHKYLPDPSARQPVVSASECKVYEPMLGVNLERGIELSNPRWNIQACPSDQICQPW